MARTSIVRRAAIGLSLPAAAGALILSATAASATSPHFVRASDSVNNAGSLVVSFKEAGLGNNQLISYTSHANATAVYACINGGGNHPRAANKETVSGPVSASGTFSSGQNGQISQSLTAGPPGPGSFSCPPGQRLELASVSYTGVSITDTTNSTTENLANVSRTFFNV